MLEVILDHTIQVCCIVLSIGVAGALIIGAMRGKKAVDDLKDEL